MWTYERTIFGGQPFRAFVWMQGHTHTNFENPQIRGCSCAPSPGLAKWPIDALMTVRQPERTGRGGRGGRGGA